MFNRYALMTLTVLIAAVIFVQPVETQINTPPSPNQIKFDSQPPQTGQVGVRYVYTAHAVARDSAAVLRYFADRMNPPGLTIDSVSGIVNWIPAAKGWYAISLIARSDKRGEATQRFMVAVGSGNGVAQGKVTDTLNVGIPDVVVEVLQATGPKLPEGGCYAYAARTDNNGNYRISGIDPGVYKLHAVSPSPQYASQWYDGKVDPTEANKISIADSPAVTIVNFRLTGGASRLPNVTVSGVVTDTASLPIKNSGVFFVRAGFALNSNTSIDDFRKYFDMGASKGDFRLEGRSQHVYQARVDSLGNYSLQIPGGSYVAFAKAPGHATEFYLGQSDLLSATLLVLQQDSAGINFTLSLLPPVALGTITGSVLDSTKGVGVPSRIIASRDRWTSDDRFGEPRSYFVDTDSLGNFTIDQLLPGSYFVFAVPLGNYAPAFYSTDTVTTKWKRAAKVVIDGNTVNGIDIYVKEIPSSVSGYADISGTVRLTSGSASTLAGAIVYANRDNVIAGYAITDVRGNYSIDGLAPGTYSVSVDRPGYTGGASKTGTVTYSAAGNPVNTNVDLGISSVTIVGQASTVQPEQYTLGQNYPNPFNPSTMIRYTLPVSGRVAVRVYNMLGQAVATLVDGNQNAGTYEVTFNASALSSGVYFYRIESGSFTAVKKMMLLK